MYLNINPFPIVSAGVGTVLLPFAIANEIINKNEYLNNFKNDSVNNKEKIFLDTTIINNFINGLSIGPVIIGEHSCLQGLQISIFSTQIGKSNGLSICGFSSFYHKFNGLALSGSLNRVIEGNGVQIGLLNITEKMKGFQFGLINVSREMRGFQLGLWNNIGKRGFPILNFRFKKK